MSVVACKILKDRIEVCADSIIISRGANEQNNLKGEKIWASDEMIVGSSGSLSEALLFELFCKTHKPSSPESRDILEFLGVFADWLKKKTDKWSIGNSYIFAFQGRVYHFYGFNFSEINTFDAIGAGCDYAIAAMHLGHSTKEAIKVACAISVYCSEPIIGYSMAVSGKNQIKKL